jgi:hypothetical protein
MKGGFGPIRILGNWDASSNPFGMVAPPPAFLQWLKEYDKELLVMPGMTEPVYRLARRSPNAKKLKAVARDSETRRMIRVGAVPVTSLARNPNWEGVKLWIRKADIWAAGGPEKFAKLLEQAEAADAQRQQAAADDEGYQRAISGWHGWKFRTGQATFVQDASRSTHEDGQPSGLHAGPGPTGDIADGSLHSEPCPGEAEGGSGQPQAENHASAQDAVLVPGAARG